MHIVTITAVETQKPDQHYTAVGLDFDTAAKRINLILRRAFDKRDTGIPWEDIPLSDSHSYNRSTLMGNLHFRIDRHEVNLP